MARIETTGLVTLVDTNVLLDVLTEDARWVAWSTAALERALDDGAVVISPIVYAELAGRYSTIEALNDALPPDAFRRDAIPWEAAYLAGRAHFAYRRRGGSRERTLPDFVIGAHAAVRRYRLLTRDPRHYRTAFPRLEILAP